MTCFLLWGSETLILKRICVTGSLKGNISLWSRVESAKSICVTVFSSGEKHLSHFLFSSSEKHISCFLLWGSVILILKRICVTVSSERKYIFKTWKALQQKNMCNGYFKWRETLESFPSFRHRVRKIYWFMVLLSQELQEFPTASPPHSPLHTCKHSRLVARVSCNKRPANRSSRDERRGYALQSE